MPGPVPSEVAVRLRGLTVQRDGLSILSDINADIPRGGCTVLVGPNGAGKSTLLLCLIGEMPHEGRVTFPASGHTAPRMAYVPQHVQLDAGLPLTVLEFLALGQQRRPLWLGIAASVRAQALNQLDAVQAAHLARRRMGDLSGGEQRRVLLAAALARRPRLLLLDEPAAGVDAGGERLFWEVLDAARREQDFTLIMVSHNLSLTAHYATQVLCLKGCLLRSGTPHTALTAPTLRALFGVPIHLYPEQCEEPDETCAQCGAHCHSTDTTACGPSAPQPPRSGSLA
ncbi:ATP-binding cassette domain-containing protein [uncultured Desulfovibrio sp.]|uniref:metal ABC transporter ATP-binding protein n=1 Tax=uncultured Desulfovibrio sp. TaxID=167968 RepID=UPI002615BEFB|nr:ATP-binding cassette domain-containing protein [uncultured Desulfovibrio sp.]